MISVLHVLASPGAAAVRLLPILADAAIKGVVVFGVAAVAVMFCRRCSAATRHAIWAGAVLAQLTLPVMSAMLPAWRVPLIDRLESMPVLAPMPAAAPAAFDVIFTPPVPAVAPLPIVIEKGARTSGPTLRGRQRDPRGERGPRQPPRLPVVAIASSRRRALACSALSGRYAAGRPRGGCAPAQSCGSSALSRSSAASSLARLPSLDWHVAASGSMTVVGSRSRSAWRHASPSRGR